MLLALLGCQIFAQIAPQTDPYKAYLADRVAWNQQHYAKTEVYIPMRDGKKLFTVLFTPKDETRTYPILLNRTPYGHDDGKGGSGYGKDKAVPFMASIREACIAEDGFIMVGQDARGRFMSAEGDFQDVRPLRSNPKAREIDESTDTYDTIEWLLKNTPGNNGKVGLYGQSYDGFYAASGMVRHHPALKATILSAPVTDWWDGDDIHRNGAIRLAQTFYFYAYLVQPQPQPVATAPDQEPPTPDGYSFFLNLGSLSKAGLKLGMEPSNFWNEIVRHPNRDAFGKARDLRPHMKDLKTAVMTVGGWFDNENLFGSLNIYQAIRAQNPNAEATLVLGPWVHGNWRAQAVKRPDLQNGDELEAIKFGHRLSLDFQEKMELPFLRHHLKEDGNPAIRGAMAFRTGSNTWHTFPAWPPRDTQPTPVYFQEQGRWSFQPSSKGRADTFVSDPMHPVPYTKSISFDYYQPYMVEDQRFVATRPDVLVYQTDPLTEDLTIAGAMKADLWVSTTGTDADWVVKVIDIWPDDAKAPEVAAAYAPLGGYQQLVRGDIMRGKYRLSLEKPEPFLPGKPTQVAFDMLDCFHTFKKGHRLMVQVQSSWFPLFDRNPQTFMNIMEATPEQFRKATHMVFRTTEWPSRIVLPVLRTTPGEK
jgi:putative CocE/NonD family hydrolase